MKKTIFALGIIGLILISGFYIKQKFYNSKRSLEKTKTEVKKLVDNNEIKSGDLIFQTSLSGQSKARPLKAGKAAATLITGSQALSPRA